MTEDTSPGCATYQDSLRNHNQPWVILHRICANALCQPVSKSQRTQLHTIHEPPHADGKHRLPCQQLVVQRGIHNLRGGVVAEPLA